MSFEDLLAAAQKNPTEADFHSLRMAYARSSHYQPYAHDLENVDALRHALHLNDLEGALGAIQNLLANRYLDIEAHMASDYVYTMQGDSERSVYHRAFARGLIDAILASGSGQDFDSAFIVIDVPEEYAVLRVIGLKTLGQELVIYGDHQYDVFTVQHPETGARHKLYFNIDLPKTWLRAHLDEQQADHS